VRGINLALDIVISSAGRIRLKIISVPTPVFTHLFASLQSQLVMCFQWSLIVESII
jgi:hypothetical protein